MKIHFHRSALAGCAALFLAVLSLAPELRAQVNPNIDDHLVHLGQGAAGTISVTRTGYVYHLKFVGDEVVDYSIDLADHAVARGVIRVYESSSDSWPIHDGGAGYRLANGLVATPQWLADYTVLKDAYKTPNSVVMEFEDNADGVIHKRRHTYTLRGKSLTIKVQDLLGNRNFLANFCGFLVFPSVGLESPSYLKIQGALATPIVAFLNGSSRWYYGQMLDMPASNSADYFLDMEPIQPGSSTVLADMHTFNGYKYQSNGKICAPLNDTISITVSSRLRDVLVTPTQAPSPYNRLLRDRMMMALPENGWSAYGNLWTLLQSWGIDDVAGYFFNWSAGGPDLATGEHIGPDWYPATNSSAFGPMVQAGAAKGYLLGGYMAFNIMPPTAPLAVFNPGHIARDANFTPKMSVQMLLPMLATTASEIHAARETDLVKQNYGMNMAYLDIQTYASPSKGADGDHLDQQSGSRFANTLARALYEQKRWMRRMSDTYEGPLVGEGSIATRDSEMEWLWAGYCDSVQRVINTNAGIHANAMAAGDPNSPTLWPINPEFELRVMARLQANHGNGFPDRFFSKSDGPGFVNMTTGNPIFPMNEAMLDRYRAYEITYGKTSYIQINGPFDGIGNYTYLADLLKEFYLMNELQIRYMEGPINTIEYFSGGSYKTVEQMLAPTGNDDVLRDPQMRLKYTNGLEIYVNHKPAAWNVTVNGVAYTIPEDGFVAWQPSTSFRAFSAATTGTNGNRIDYCNAPGRYEFFDGRGAVSAFGGIDTGTIKRLRVRNDVHAVTIWEGSNGTCQATQGTPPAATNVSVLPGNVSMASGERIALKAVATFSNGSHRDVTTLVNWSSSATNVGRINEGAALTAMAPGTVQITCTSFGGAPVTPATIQVN